MSFASMQALDAADGRIDGTYFGQKIVGTGASGASDAHARAAEQSAAAALALDAADGRIDGTYFGRTIVQGGNTHVTRQPDPYEVRYFYTNNRDPCMLPMVGDNESHKYEDIVQRHQYKGIPWEDTTEYNLPNHMVGREDPPELLFPHQIQLWRHSVPYLKGDDHADVKIGPYAGTSFPAALQGILSLGRERLPDLFGRIHESCGVFEVKLFSWVQGLGWVPLIVCVDAKIPICPNSSTPAFSYSERHSELWPIFLEKAFVKATYNGKGYVSVSNAPGHDNISPSLILSHLFGCQSEVYVMAGKVTNQIITDLLKRHVELSHVVFVKVRESIDARKLGLIPMFYYVVIDIKEIDGTGQRLIQLQNPYGKTSSSASQWKGSFSQFDQSWNPALAEVAELRRVTADGQFYMEGSDAAIFFSEVHVAELQPRITEEDKDLVDQLRKELLMTKSQLSRAEGALRNSGISLETTPNLSAPPAGYREGGPPSTMYAPALGQSVPQGHPASVPSTYSSYAPHGTGHQFGGPSNPAAIPAASPMSSGVPPLNGYGRFTTAAPSVSSVQSSYMGSPLPPTRRSIVSSASVGR